MGVKDGRCGGGEHTPLPIDLRMPSEVEYSECSAATVGLAVPCGGVAADVWPTPHPARTSSAQAATASLAIGTGRPLPWGDVYV